MRKYPELNSSGLIKLGFLVLLLSCTLRWQKTYDEIRQILLEERFLADEKLNYYLLERLGSAELEKARSTFIKLCRSVSNCGVVPPFIHYESRHVVAPKYRASTCVIYKNMSTIMTAIMCYLYDAVTYKKKISDMTRDIYPQRFCKEKNEYESIRILDHFRSSPSQQEQPWLPILIARDPLERFLSGFINKCLREGGRPNACYNCGVDLQCVMERQYERLMGAAQTSSIVHTVEDSHFAPQSWHCELRDNFRRYKIIKYNGSSSETMINELEAYFEKQGVEQGILNDIRAQIIGRRTFHATHNHKKRATYENQLRSSPYLMTLLVKMFYYDFLLFGYSLPQIE